MKDRVLTVLTGDLQNCGTTCQVSVMERLFSKK
jgi:hypothetical protein